MPHTAINKKPDKRAKKPLDLVHSDLSGQLSPADKNGYQYAMVFVDDYSGMTFHYLLKNKSDATRAMEKFIADVAPIGKIKRLRSDNGGEYLGEFKDVLIKQSIKHELSSPHTPQQNGTAERSWRTAFDMARCLLLDSELPKNLWSYALLTSGYTRNRCYQQRTGSTPYELFTGRRPNLRNMVAFGTKCFVYNDNQKRKLDDRSHEGVFIGYDRESPAYLIYNRDSRAVKKSRNVKFDIVSTPSALCDPVGVEEDVVVRNDNDQSVVNDHDQSDCDMDIRNNPDDTSDKDERPKRAVKPPKYLTDNYVLNNDDSACLINDDIDIDYCYKMCITGNDIPQTYGEAMASPQAKEWHSAMKDEINSLHDNDTWSIKTLPEGKSVVGGKWVYSVKLDKNNDVTKYKARFVARGFSQIPGIDYHDTFAPTARLTSIRALMQCSVQYDLIVHQLDVKTAYLNANIDCNIFMEQPEGFEKGGNNMVCHLNKSIYGLKQSGRMWNKVLHNFLTEKGFKRSEVDHCLYLKKCNDDCIVYVLVWVDDIIVSASNMQLMSETKSLLHKRFKMVDMGQLSWFLGIDFKFENDCVSLSQAAYLKNVLAKFKMQDCRPTKTPCDKFILNENSKDYSSTEYRSAVGSLIYAMVCTRPDISWIITKLSQYLHKPTEDHWVAVKRLLRYIKHSINYCLCFRKVTDGLSLIGYCDSDWASSVDAEGSRRSVTGYCFHLSKSSAALSWKSRKQPTVALSSCEAEYMALASATQEALYLKQLLTEIDPQFDKTKVITLFEDNQGTIALVNNPVYHQRTKHIDIRYHFIREQVHDKCINVEYLLTSLMIADCLTKPMGRVKLDFCIKSLLCMS